MNKYDYVKYDAEQIELQKKAQDLFIELEGLLNQITYGIFPITTPMSDIKKAEIIPVIERSYKYSEKAEEKLEEAYMYFGKAIRDRQIILGESSEDVLERSDG